VVDALLVLELEEIVEIEGTRLVALAGHLDGPGNGLVVAGELPDRAAAAGQELVEVVVRTRDLARRQFLPLDHLGDLVGLVLLRGKHVGPGIRNLQHLRALGVRAAGEGVGPDERGASQRLHEGPAVEEDLGIGNGTPDGALFVTNPLGSLDEMAHWYAPRAPGRRAGAGSPMVARHRAPVSAAGAPGSPGCALPPEETR